MLEPYVKRILASRVYDVAQETPLSKAPLLSARLGHEVFLKREDMQPVFSFKIRGAFNCIAQLDPEAQKRGVITASAGNHAQGVALAAAHLGLKATIVMGRNTPDIKVDAVRRRGAKVVLHGDGYDDAAKRAAELVESEGATYIPPFDHPDVIAGQGTVGMEILNQCGEAPDAIFVPVGGGGLISGIGAYVKYLKPGTRIIGVEAEGSACLAAALKAGRRVRLPAETLDLFADGVSVAQVGKETFRVARCVVDDVITVSTDEICAAVKDVFEDTRTIAEPSGALAIAGMKKYLQDRESKADSAGRFVAVVSGANVNFDRLRHITERAEIGEHREAVLAVTIPEKPGSFRRFCRVIGKRAVTEFNYRYAERYAGQAVQGSAEESQARVFVGVQRAAGDDDFSALFDDLQQAGYEVSDMTSNEMAKAHVRYMVGGQARAVSDELLFRVEFPERPGALMKFLSGLGARWNITMFHYRNHGAAWGRVLVGFAAGKDERASLTEHLNSIGYRFSEESDNTAYQQFLR